MSLKRNHLRFTVTQIHFIELHQFLISHFSVFARTDRQTYTQTNNIRLAQHIWGAAQYLVFACTPAVRP